MRINDARGDMKPGLGNSHHSDPAIVVGNILQEPFDGVVRIAALIDVLWSFFVRPMGSDLLEFPLRHISPPCVLIDEDETLFLKIFRGAKARSVLIDAVRPDTIRCACYDKGVFL